MNVRNPARILAAVTIMRRATGRVEAHATWVDASGSPRSATFACGEVAAPDAFVRVAAMLAQDEPREDATCATLNPFTIYTDPHNRSKI